MIKLWLQSDTGFFNGDKVRGQIYVEVERDNGEKYVIGGGLILDNGDEVYILTDNDELKHWDIKKDKFMQEVAEYILNNPDWKNRD